MTLRRLLLLATSGAAILAFAGAADAAEKPMSGAELRALFGNGNETSSAVRARATSAFCC
jgi:hypothetical protein